MKSRQHFDRGILAEWKGKLDRSDPAPLYAQLKRLLLEKIRDGTLQSGDSVPTEDELRTVLDISRPTIRQCMQELTAEGYLTRRVGKGTFVTQPKMEFNYINQHESFNEIISKYGNRPHTNILAFRIVPPVPKICAALEIPADDQLYYLRRIYFSGDDPIVSAETWLQASRFPGLLDFDFSRLSLYATLRNAFDTRVALLRREVGAENGTPEDVATLGIPKGRAVFEVVNVGFGEDGRPIEYTYARYRSELIKFTNYLKC